MKTRPWTMLLMMLAGWLNRHQQDEIGYLREENKILREKLGKKRIFLSDNQRMRLARLGKRIGRKVLLAACYAFLPIRMFLSDTVFAIKTDRFYN